MGRPTKYKKEFIKEAEIYLDECEKQRKIPFIEELAKRLEVTKMTVWNWTEAHPDFLYAVEKIKDHQCMALQTLGLKSPAMLIFLLEANHGMMRTERIQHEGKSEEPLSIIFTDVATWKRAKDNGQE